MEINMSMFSRFIRPPLAIKNFNIDKYPFLEAIRKMYPGKTFMFAPLETLLRERSEYRNLTKGNWLVSTAWRKAVSSYMCMFAPSERINFRMEICPLLYCTLPF